MAAADDGASMLALANRSKNGRQRSAAEAERFTDACSQLDAFRHPIDEEDADHYFILMSAVICDRYAFLSVGSTSGCRCRSLFEA